MSSKDISRSIRITPRDRSFAFPDVDERDWLAGDTLKSLIFNALSTTFPAGERFFIASVKRFRGRITDEPLKSQVNGFMAQEAMHTREHVRYNQQIATRGCRTAMLQIETQERFEWAQHKYSDLEQLAATCALEHFTAILADELLSNPDLLKDARTEYRNVWLWHAIEEAEHKGVAFDVFQEVTNGRAYWVRVRTMIIVTSMFLTHMSRLFSVLLDDVGRGRSVTSRLRLNWLLWGNPGLFRRMMLKWAAYFRPGFHPWDRDNRARMQTAESALALASE